MKIYTKIKSNGCKISNTKSFELSLFNEPQSINNTELCSQSYITLSEKSRNHKERYYVDDNKNCLSEINKVTYIKEYLENDIPTLMETISNIKQKHFHQNDSYVRLINAVGYGDLSSIIPKQIMSSYYLRVENNEQAYGSYVLVFPLGFTFLYNENVFNKSKHRD